MTKSELQRYFVTLVVKLLTWIHQQGYEVSFGETWRSPTTAEANARAGIGIAHSLHIERLAIDLNLFKDGVYTANPADYKPLGDYWKSLDPLARWGGDFHTVDADHFSLTFDGKE